MSGAVRRHDATLLLTKKEKGVTRHLRYHELWPSKVKLQLNKLLVSKVQSMEMLGSCCGRGHSVPIVLMAIKLALRIICGALVRQLHHRRHRFYLKSLSKTNINMRTWLKCRRPLKQVNHYNYLKNSWFHRQHTLKAHFYHLSGGDWKSTNMKLFWSRILGHEFSLDHPMQ